MKKTLFIFFLFFSVRIFAQKTTNSIGAELQAYPRGVIPGVTFEHTRKTHNAFHLRTGLNITDHKNSGKHDDEWGNGFGFTIGYRYYFTTVKNGLFIGARSDLWYMNIKWRNELPNVNIAEGNSKVTVLQPTAEIGYMFPVSKQFSIALATEQGIELNIHTKGEKTGHGFISLVGIRLQYSF